MQREPYALGAEHQGDYGLGIGEPYALETQRRLRFGHGCKRNRMLLEREGDYGLGMDVMVTVWYGLSMDAMVTICSWSTNEIMVWAWM